MNTETEISTQQEATPRLSFSRRLRDALEVLDEGKELVLKTREDRQTITNVVLAVKKKKGVNLKTELVQRRDDEGKIIIRIYRPAPLAPDAA